MQCFVPSQRPEQQSALPAHSFPDVLHCVLSAAQVLLAPQTPPQQSALAAQALPSEMQLFAEHEPETQLSEQHSVATLHALPEALHELDDATQPVFASQVPEQQSAPLAQGSASERQLPAAPPTPVLPAVSPKPPVPTPAPTPASPASADAPALLPLGSLDEVEPPQPTQKAVAAMRIAPRIRAGRAVFWFILYMLSIGPATWTVCGSERQWSLTDKFMIA